MLLNKFNKRKNQFMYKYVLLLSCFVFVLAEAKCQDEPLPRGSDSLQSLIMRDSLKMDSIQIRKVLRARDVYLQKTNQLFQNKNLSEGQKRERSQALRLEVNTFLKETLGQAKYQAYKNFITKRIRERRLPGGNSLLGEDG